MAVADQRRDQSGISWTHPTLVSCRRTESRSKERWPWPGRPEPHPLGRHHRDQWQNHGHASAQPRAQCQWLRRPMAGNVGISAAEIARQLQQQQSIPEWLVMELSSYQIEAAPMIRPGSASGRPHARPPGTPRDARGLSQHQTRPAGAIRPGDLQRRRSGPAAASTGSGARPLGQR